MLRFQKCCCCSLRTGSLVMGYLYLAANILSMVAAIQLYLQHYAEPISPDSKHYIQRRILQATVISSMVIGSIHIILTTLMVIGVHTYKMDLVFPWIAIEFLFLMLKAIAFVIGSGILLFLAFATKMYTLILIVLVMILILVLKWALVTVVYSHYKDTVEEYKHDRFFYPEIEEEKIIIP